MMYTKKYDWFKDQNYPSKVRISILEKYLWKSFNKIVKAIEALNNHNFNAKIVNTILYSRAFLSKKI